MIYAGQPRFQEPDGLLSHQLAVMTDIRRRHVRKMNTDKTAFRPETANGKIFQLPGQFRLFIAETD